MAGKCSSGLLLLKWLQWFQPPLPEHDAHIQKPSIQVELLCICHRQGAVWR